MKTFLIINGTKVTVIERESMEDARDYATNFMNHSYEVIVREVDNFSYQKNKSERLSNLLVEWKDESKNFKRLSDELRLSTNALVDLNKDLYEECSRLGINIKDLKLEN